MLSDHRDSWEEFEDKSKDKDFSLAKTAVTVKTPVAFSSGTFAGVVQSASASTTWHVANPQNANPPPRAVGRAYVPARCHSPPNGRLLSRRERLQPWYVSQNRPAPAG